MQQLISWSKNLALLYFKQMLLKLLGRRIRIIIYCWSPRVIAVKNRFKVPKGNIIQVKSRNKQIPNSSGSNEKRFLKGRSPAFLRNKRLRARYIRARTELNLLYSSSWNA